jgi:hypothetical protein
VTGRIEYKGDPGAKGEYMLTTHSGDLEVTIPAASSVQIKKQSLNGETDTRDPDAASGIFQKNLFLKPGLVRTSRFVLRSFQGKIHVKRP